MVGRLGNFIDPSMKILLCLCYDSQWRWHLISARPGRHAECGLICDEHGASGD
jgi:hypothetical protein